MSEAEENKIAVIKQTDPYLPEFMDFKNLRKEGLEHIGRLSGKIWTDHNVHDPGITILEVLVYALMDLGYKTNLPFEDLLTPKDPQDTDDNFLTPLQALTVNPVTITDYIKLLLEHPKIRNAWLEPAEEEKLYINPRHNSLSCHPYIIDASENLFADVQTGYGQIRLNGLYTVYIEKESDVTNDEKLADEVKALLSEYRNLCEDVQEVIILKPVEFDVCVEAELRPGYKAEKVYREMIMAIKEFIQPQIRYYTLQQLLDKGRTIDHIFAGRPYRMESVGFVDTEELENLEKRKCIHLSDLYNVVLSVEGVRKIKKIHLKGGKAIGNDPIKCAEKVPSPENGERDENHEWSKNSAWKDSNMLDDDEVPFFSLEKTCVGLCSAEGPLEIDKAKIHQSFSLIKKFELPLNNLDGKVPEGKYLDDLKDNYSIQHDFPVVYGIGDDGLPDSATLQRKTQALQLKGYLMFYDQMLANYTSQLVNLRSLFSLKPEKDRNKTEKQTYFTQVPETIPELDKLLKFYGTENQLDAGSELALPVSNGQEWKDAVKKLNDNGRIALTIGNYCNSKDVLVGLYNFPNANIREIYINQLIDSFFNENYTIRILSDRYGYFFVLYPNLPNDILLVGAKRYPEANKAENEARNVAFIASMEKSYHLVTDRSEDTSADKHYMGIHYHPISYVDLIQELSENREEYRSRRKQFLDHLLARFGEDFTDYTLLQYQQQINSKEGNGKIIDDQSAYISKFAEISRNRGKAFNYMESSWNTDNVSGFEKRVSLLAGIENYHRRNLCNFEVSSCYKLFLKDWKGNVFFQGNRSYETKEEWSDATEKMLSLLRDPGSYPKLEKSLNGFNATNIHRIFSAQPAEENIVVTKYNYHQRLLNAGGDVVAISSNTRISSFKAASDKKAEFIRSIHNQNIKIPKPNGKTYRLLSIDRENRYLDTNALDVEINTHISYKWHVLDTATREKITSDPVFKKTEEAWQDMLANAPLSGYLTRHDTALHWNLRVNKHIVFRARNFYPDAHKALTAWRQAKTLGSTAENYTIEEGEDSFTMYIKSEKGSVVAVSAPIKTTDYKIETAIEEAAKVFGNRNTQPAYDKVKEKFGFEVPVNNLSPLVSYCVFDTGEEALQKIKEVYSQGRSKKYYLLSGDEGNPEYNFILRDENDSFLALPPDHIETKPDRDKALNATIRFFKNNKLPVSVDEEPRHYTWSLFDARDEVMASHTEFPSKAKAKADFDRVVAKEALKPHQKLFAPHQYEFQVQSTPALYKFLYGSSDSRQDFEPVFISSQTFKKREEVSLAYNDFVRKLPGLTLKVSEKKRYDFVLHEASGETPIAVQYRKGKHRASEATVRALTAYHSNIYTESGDPREDFVNNMIENQEEMYEWRFYKKNAPLAINPYCCSSKRKVGEIKPKICEVTPPVNLRECPKKEVVVCPEKDPGKYHYKVCFTINDGREFVLVSYVGYNTYEEAEEAWKEEWLDIIVLAKDKEEYKNGGGICIDEKYKAPGSTACDETSCRVVIPEEIREEIGDEEDVIEHYTRLADLFPIYKEQVEDKIKYKYRVVVPDEGLKDFNCDYTGGTHLGSLIWVSVACYESWEEAIRAYQHFYVLAGIPNNCRILCSRGCFYVGLIEVLAESFCKFTSEGEAWNDNFTKNTDECGTCVPGGVREFIYAAEDDKNYIPVCDGKYWKFKVVSPPYFIVDHNCYYRSEAERDEAMKKWQTALKELDWKQYFISCEGPDEPDEPTPPVEGRAFMHFEPLAEVIRDNRGVDIHVRTCDIVEAIRKCLKRSDKTNCSQNEIESLLGNCLREELGEDAYATLEQFPELDIDSMYRIANYYPIYKTEDGYCFRLYWPENDIETTGMGLQPCGCEDAAINEGENVCKEPYPFISSNCYTCCTEAIEAFRVFCELIKEGNYTAETTSVGAYGPYSFYMSDKRKELAYHPQQYQSLQEVKDAIKMTKGCVNNTGMHLLEHILLRPGHQERDNDNSSEETYFDRCSCLLPICPDRHCPIEWQPDTDARDPCAKEDMTNILYLPGSDPYSFWATLALPAWAKRFRTQQARSAFEKLLYKEVPALVGLHILWLNPRDMCKFEDAFRKWLEWMQHPDELCDPNGEHPYCMLVKCIAELRSEKPCQPVTEVEGDCKCEEEKGRDIEECCLPGETTGTIFWNCCREEDRPEGGRDVTNVRSAVVEAAPSKVKTKARKKAATSTKKTKSKTKKGKAKD